MAKYLYNGVLLPEIPADVLAEFPYAWIKTDYTQLYVSKVPWFNNNNYLSFGSITAENRAYKVSESGEEWVLRHTFTDNGGYTPYVFWSNYDIPNGSADATEIYFYGSEPVDPNAPEEPTEEVYYKISGERLTAIANAIRGKTGKEDSLTLEQMVTEIEGIEAGGSAPNGTNVTFGNVDGVPVEREEAYTILGATLNELGALVQDVSSKTALMTIEEMIYQLRQVQFLPTGKAISEFNIGAITFETSAEGQLQGG